MLQAGGASAQLTRDTGTANAVQGQHAFGSALQGANLPASLPTTVVFQASDEAAQLNQTVANAALSPNALSHGHVIAATTASGSRNVLADALSHGHILQAASLGASGALATEALTHAHTISVPGVSTLRNIAANTLTHSAHVISVPSVNASGAVAADFLTHAHTISAPSFTAAQHIAASGLSHTHEFLESLASGAQALAVATWTHAHVQGIPLLPLGWHVSPNGVSHAQIINVATLTYRLIVAADLIEHSQVFAAPGVSRGSTLGLTPEQVWDYEIVPGVSAARMLRELWLMQGLDSDNPLHVGQTSRQVADIAQTISEQSGAVTVTRQ